MLPAESTRSIMMPCTGIVRKDELVIEKAETKDGSDLQSLPFCGILLKAMRRKGWCLLMLVSM